jgi:hypothetical protein
VHTALRGAGVPAFATRVSLPGAMQWKLQDSVMRFLTDNKVTGLAAIAATHAISSFVEDPTSVKKIGEWTGGMSEALGTLKDGAAALYRRLNRKRLYTRVVEHLAPPPSSNPNSVYVALAWFLSQWSTKTPTQVRKSPAGVVAAKAKVARSAPESMKVTSESDMKFLFSDKEMKAGSGVPDVQTSEPYSENQGITRNGTRIAYRRGHTTRSTSVGDKVINRDIYTITLESESLEAIQDLIQEVLEEYERYLIDMAKKIQYFTLQRSSSMNASVTWKSEPFNNHRRLETIALPDGCDLLQHVHEFQTNEAWYADRGLPYKCVVLLHGPPGTGKSVTANAICNFLGRSKCNLSLQFFRDDQELFAARAAIDVRQVVFVIDDCDAHVNALLQRTDALPPPDKTTDDMSAAETLALAQAQAMHAMAIASMQSKIGGQAAANTAAMGGKPSTITLAGFLQFLDGYGADGMVVVMTTNMKDKLDRALWRSCRVDYCLEMPAVSADQVKKLYSLFYAGLELADESLPDLARYPELVSADIEAVFREFKFKPIEAAAALSALVPHT